MRHFLRVICCLMCLALTVPALASETTEPSTTPTYLATLTKNAYLRAEPSTDAQILRLINVGEQVDLLASYGDWYTVRFGQTLGYLHRSLIETATLSPSVDVKGDGLEVYRTLGKGEKGLAVRLLQSALTALGYDPGEVDGEYGHKTYLAVADFQAYQAMTVTGIADERTQRLLYSGNATPAPTPAYVRPTLRSGSTVSEVAELQVWLINLGYLDGLPSGQYDKATEKAIMSFQKDEGLPADGITGAKTWARIDAFVAILTNEAS